MTEPKLPNSESQIETRLTPARAVATYTDDLRNRNTYSPDSSFAPSVRRMSIRSRNMTTTIATLRPTLATFSPTNSETDSTTAGLTGPAAGESRSFYAWRTDRLINLCGTSRPPSRREAPPNQRGLGPLSLRSRFTAAYPAWRSSFNHKRRSFRRSWRVVPPQIPSV